MRRHDYAKSFAVNSRSNKLSLTRKVELFLCRNQDVHRHQQQDHNRVVL